VLTILAEAVAAMRLGHLPNWNYGEGLKYLHVEVWHTDWHGIQYLLDWLTRLNIMAFFMLVGLLVSWVTYAASGLIAAIIYKILP